MSYDIRIEFRKAGQSAIPPVKAKNDALALTFAQTVAAPRILEPGPLLRLVSVWN
jgi:hypothetical protein